MPVRGRNFALGRRAVAQPAHAAATTGPRPGPSWRWRRQSTGMRRLRDSWQVNCLCHAAKAALPFKSSLRRLKRRIGARGCTIDEKSSYSGGFDHILALRDAGADVKSRDILEVGTGWYPVIPLMMRVAGANRIYLTDVEPLLDSDSLLDAIDFLLERKSDLAARLELPVELVEQRLRIARQGSLEDMLAQLDMVYIVPFRPDEHSIKVHAIVSHTVLEHVPKNAVVALLSSAKALLRDGGVMSHGIDNSDHRANVHKTLSRVDFLRYSDRLWRLLSIGEHTNRLRHQEYRRIMELMGFEICSERAVVNPACVEDAKSLPLSGKFRQMDVMELATLWSHFVARPAGTRSTGS